MTTTRSRCCFLPRSHRLQMSTMVTSRVHWGNQTLSRCRVPARSHRLARCAPRRRSHRHRFAVPPSLHLKHRIPSSANARRITNHFISEVFSHSLYMKNKTHRKILERASSANARRVHTRCFAQLRRHVAGENQCRSRSGESFTENAKESEVLAFNFRQRTRSRPIRVDE